MTTSSHSDPTGDPATDSAVQRILATAASLGTKAFLVVSAFLSVIVTLGLTPENVAMHVGLASWLGFFGAESLGILVSLWLDALKGKDHPADVKVALQAALDETKLPDISTKCDELLKDAERQRWWLRQISALANQGVALSEDILSRVASLGADVSDIRERMHTADKAREYHEREMDAIGELARPAIPIPQERPPTASHFTGREAELAELREALVPGRIVTLTGIGGMGKTSLAAACLADLEATGDLDRRFPGGVILCNFYDDNDVERAAAHIARSCGLDPRPHALDAAQAALGARVALLVLDGAEAADNLPKLLDRRGRSGVLITSRAKGDVHDIDIPVRRLSPDEAVALLQQWGREQAADRDAAAAVCELVGNLPLAVTLAGQYLWASQTPAAEYLDWLRESGLEALDFGHRRRESVPVLLGGSLDRMSAAARDAVAVLGALALGPVGVEPLAAALDQPAAALRQPLADLTGYGLLRRDGGYRLGHPLLHQYARQRLAVAPAALTRLASYYTQFAKTHGSEGPSGYRLLDAQRPHIMALLPRLEAAAQWVELNDLVWVVADQGGYMDVAGHAFDRRDALEYGVTAAQALGRRTDKGAHLGHLGNAHYHLGRFEAAIGYHEQALAISREIGDRHREGTSLGNLGNAHYSRGRVEEAIGFYEQALAISRETGDRRHEGNWLGNLGITHYSLGRIEAAIGFNEQALAISRETGDRRHEGIVLGNLGNAHQALGRVESAIGFYEQTLAIHREIGERGREGGCLIDIGTAHYSLGRVEVAIGFFEQGLAISREIGDRRATGYALGNLGVTYYSLGQVETAIGFFEQALTISREIGDRRGECVGLQNLGEANLATGRVLLATDQFQQALAIAREIGFRDGEANHLGGLAEVTYAQGRTIDAIALAEEALAIDEAIKSPHAEEMRELLAKWRGEQPPSVE
jgi:tetratricopeptide (TPR) repeat protein